MCGRRGVNHTARVAMLCKMSDILSTSRNISTQYRNTRMWTARRVYLSLYGFATSSCDTYTDVRPRGSLESVRQYIKLGKLYSRRMFTRTTCSTVSEVHSIYSRSKELGDSKRPTENGSSISYSFLLSIDIYIETSAICCKAAPY